MRVGNRRLTLTWRPRKALPQLLSDLLRRSWRNVLSPMLRVSVATAAVCGAWQAPVMAAAPAPGTLPTGWSVVNGNVVFQQNGNVLNINQLSPQAIANFQSFSIGSGAAVNISQPNAAAAFLAKVTGGDISQIYGQLTAPGSVVLFNPAGIVIGAGGTVDVGRFIATTLAISDNDFLAGKLTFNKQGTAGSVENYGTIKSSTGGSVYLLGSSVTNGGVITSPQGEVILGAGETITLADTATPGVTVNVTGSAGNVTNLGEITAEAGRIGVAAGLITNSGTISASSVVKEGGRVFLRASKDLTTTATSNISADGTVGGNVTLYADNAAFLDGDISATSSTGRGGFIETSGLKSLDVVKAPKLSAGGEWYIDPYNLEVTDTTTAGDNPVSACNTDRVITSQGNNSQISAATISDYLGQGRSVTLATGSYGGSQEGNIVVNGEIVKSSGTGSAALTLNANGNITINKNITSTVGTLNLNLHTGYQSETADATRQVLVNNATIALNNGSLEVKDGSAGNWGNLTVTGANARIDAGAGGALRAANLVVNNATAKAGSLTLYGNNTGDDAIGNLSVTSQGTVNVTSGTFNVGNATVDATSNLYGNGTTTFQVTGTLDNAGFANLSGAGGGDETNGASIGFLKNSGNLTIGGLTHVTLANGANNSGTIDIGTGSTVTANGSFTNEANGTVNISSSCVTAAVTLNGSGAWTNNGSINVSTNDYGGWYFEGDSLTNAGTLTLSGLSTTLDNYTNTGTTKLSNGATLYSSGSNQYGTLNLASGTEAQLANTHFNGNFSAVGAGAMKWKNNVYLDGAVNLAASAPDLYLANSSDENVQISATNSNAANTLTTRNTVYIGNSTSSSVVLNNGTTWNNYGTVNFGIDGGTAVMSMGGGGQLVNQQGGVLNIGGSTVLGGASTLVDNKAGGTINLSSKGQIGSGSLEAGDSSLYLNNSGTVNANGGTLLMKNNAGGLLAVSNFVTVTKLTNDGNITVAENARLTGLLTNTGNVTLESNGSLAAGKIFDTLDNQGTLTLKNGYLYDYGRIDNSGSLLGSGTISFPENSEGSVLVNSGTVAPGGIGQVGTLTLEWGKYEQTETGKLLIDIAGDDSYDKVLFDGSVSLNGTLQTKILGNYVPGDNVTFQPFGNSGTTMGSAFRTVTGDIYTSSDGSKKMVKARYDQFLGEDSPSYSVVLKMSSSETLTSTQGSELNWGSASTWDKGYIPTAIDSVTIAGNSSVSSSGTDTIDTLTLAGMNSNLTLNGANLTASQVSVGDGANLTVGRTSNLTTTQLNLLAGSNMSVTNANVTANQLSMAETSNLSMSGSNFTVNTTSQIDGIIQVTSGNLTLGGTVSGAGAINIGPDYSEESGGQARSMRVAVISDDEGSGNSDSANVTIAGADSQIGIRVRDGGNLVLNGGTKIADMELTGGNVSSASGVLLTIGSNLTQSSGNLSVDQLALSAGANANISGGNVTTNQLTTADTSNLTLSGGDVTVNTSSKIDGLVKVGLGNLTLNGTTTGSGGIRIATSDIGDFSEQVGNSTLSHANVSIANANSGLGVRVADGGDLKLTGNSTIADLDVTGGNVTASSNTTLTITATSSQSGGAVSADKLTLASGANATVSGGTLTANQLTTAGTSNLTLSASGANVTVNTSSKIDGAVKVSAGNLTLGGSTTGNGTVNIGGPNTAGAPYANVSIAGGTSNLGVNVTSGGDLLLKGSVGLGNLTMSGGALRGTSDANLSVSNNLSLASGTNLTVSNFNVSANQLTLASNANLTVSGKTLTTNRLTTVDTSNLTLTGGNVTVNTGSSIGGLIKVGLGNLTLNGTATGDGGIRIATSDIGDFSQQVGNSTAPHANVSIENASSALGIRLATGGDLLLRGGVLIDDMQVIGGTVRSASGSALVVSESFSQTGGTMTLNDAALTSNLSNGDLTIGNITANNLILESQAGAIKQTANTALHVTKQLLASSTTGIALTSTGNQIAALAANNSGKGDITVVNKLNTADTTAVALNGIKTANGNISVDNTGGMVTTALGNGANFVTTLPLDEGDNMTAAKALSELGLTETGTGRVATSNGSVSLVTHSPLTIGSGGVSATGNVTLQAGSTVGSNSVLTVNGAVTTQGGNIVLSAGDSMAINANLTTSAPGAASFSVLSGNAVTYASNVVVTDVNGVQTPGVVTPVTPVNPTTPGIDTASAAAQAQQSSQTQDIQRSIDNTELAKEKKSDDDVKQADGAQSSGGQTQSSDIGDKKLPMCT